MQSRLGEADHRRDDQEAKSGEGRIPCHASPNWKNESGDKNQEPVVAGPTTRRASRIRTVMSGAGFGRNVSWMGSDEGIDRDWIAQSGEHKVVNLGVAGSSPAPSATTAVSWASKTGRRREEFKGQPEAQRGMRPAPGRRQRDEGPCSDRIPLRPADGSGPGSELPGRNDPGGKPFGRATQETLRPAGVIGERRPSPEGETSEGIDPV